MTHPYVTVEAGDGWQILTIHWPDPKPETFEITATAFEALINEINAWRRKTTRHRGAAMTDPTDIIERLRQLAHEGWLGAQADNAPYLFAGRCGVLVKVRDDLHVAAELIVRYRKATGGLDPALVAKLLDRDKWRARETLSEWLTEDEIAALSAATFEATE